MLEYVDISEKVQFFIFEFLFGNFQLVLQGMNFLQKEIFHSCKKWFLSAPGEASALLHLTFLLLLFLTLLLNQSLFKLHQELQTPVRASMYQYVLKFHLFSDLKLLLRRITCRNTHSKTVCILEVLSTKTYFRPRSAFVLNSFEHFGFENNPKK